MSFVFNKNRAENKNKDTFTNWRLKLTRATATRFYELQRTEITQNVRQSTLDQIFTLSTCCYGGGFVGEVAPN
jgi:hypothetical protein